MWQVIGASIIGTSHTKTDKPCQDYHKYYIKNGICYFGVADGLGSASHADLGARVALETGISTLIDNTVGDVDISLFDCSKYITSAFEASRAALYAEADKLHISVRELATTMILVVTSEFFTVCGHVGDGAVIAKDSSGITTISPPERLGYANETTSITSSNFISALRIFYTNKPILAVALITDGLQNISISNNDNKPFVDFYGPLFDGIEQVSDLESAQSQLAEFLQSERLVNRTDDDKTLLVAGRKRIDIVV